MRYRIILPNMVEITPVCALVYMVHVLVASSARTSIVRHYILLMLTRCQHGHNVNSRNL